MGLESLFGLMGKSMKVCGKMESNMELGTFLITLEGGDRGSGLMARGSSLLNANYIIGFYF